MDRDFQDEAFHPGHHSIRLREYDYSAPGFYFLTICTHEKQCILGRLDRERVTLSPLGRAVLNCWLAIPEHFAAVNVHTLVIMPNHVHGILEIAPVGAQHAAPLLAKISKIDAQPHVKPGSLGAIVRSLKAAVTRLARKELGWNGEVWQRNYFERTLRDGQEIADAVRYIAENPMKWGSDKENLRRME